MQENKAASTNISKELTPIAQVSSDSDSHRSNKPDSDSQVAPAQRESVGKSSQFTQIKATLIKAKPLAEGSTAGWNTEEMSDTRLGRITKLKGNKKNQIMFAKNRNICMTPSELDDLKFRLTLSHKNLLEIYGITKLPSTEDADTIEVQILFEEYTSDLEGEMRNCMYNDKYLSEAEIVEIITSVGACLHYLGSNNISHDNIIPNNILKLRNGVYKLDDNYVLNDKITLYSQVMKGINIRYASPELLNSIKKNQVNPFVAYNSQKSDVWSLAMCILDAGTLYSDEEINFFDRKTMTIDEAKLKQRVNMFKKRYSKKLTVILESMFAIKPEDRPDGELLSTVKELLNLPSIADENEIQEPASVQADIVVYKEEIEKIATNTTTTKETKEKKSERC
jgi:serine/threonine protein kinase